MANSIVSVRSTEELKESFGVGSRTITCGPLTVSVDTRLTLAPKSLIKPTSFNDEIVIKIYQKVTVKLGKFSKTFDLEVMSFESILYTKSTLQYMGALHPIPSNPKLR